MQYIYTDGFKTTNGFCGGGSANRLEGDQGDAAIQRATTTLVLPILLNIPGSIPDGFELDSPAERARAEKEYALAARNEADRLVWRNMGGKSTDDGVGCRGTLGSRNGRV